MFKKTLMNIMVFIMCIVLGFFISMQFNQDIQSSGFVSLTSIEQMNKDIANLEKDVENLRLMLSEKKKNLLDIENASSEQDITEVLKKDIEDLKLISGYKDLVGDGVLIVVDDSDPDSNIDDNNEYFDIVHDIYLTNIVNELRKQGAEAISINGERVLSTSEINCGGPIIRVNGRSITNPFTIAAIGDPKKLYNIISGPKGYGTHLKEYLNLKISTFMMDSMVIEKYKVLPNLKYAKTKQEGD